MKNTKTFGAVRKLREKIFKVQGQLNQQKNDEKQTLLKLENSGKNLEEIKENADQLLQRIFSQRDSIENRFI